MELILLRWPTSKTECRGEMRWYSSQSVCNRVTRELHQYEGPTPVRSTAITAAISINRSATTAVPDARSMVLEVDTPYADWLDNKAFACFRNGSAGNYVFYYVMAEQ